MQKPHLGLPRSHFFFLDLHSVHALEVRLVRVSSCVDMGLQW